MLPTLTVTDPSERSTIVPHIAHSVPTIATSPRPATCRARPGTRAHFRPIRSETWPETMAATNRTTPPTPRASPTIPGPRPSSASATIGITVCTTAAPTENWMAGSR